MGRAVSIDGTPCSEGEARISVFDRGFLYGDGVCELLRTYDGTPFAVEEHLGRLQRSALRCGIPMPVPLGQLRAEIERELRTAANDESVIRVVVTRGVAPSTGLASMGGATTRVVLVEPLVWPPDTAYRDGAHAITLRVARAPTAFAAHDAKTLSALGGVLAMRAARASGGAEALLVNVAEGGAPIVLEGSTSNVFLIAGDELITPHVDATMLAGVTRERVLDLAASAGLRAVERPVPLSDLWCADEVFITSTIRELLPIVSVDDHVVAEGRPGVATRRLHRAFRERAVGRRATMPWGE
jgi:branched-chain amino acid aminotransferase